MCDCPGDTAGYEIEPAARGALRVETDAESPGVVHVVVEVDGSVELLLPRFGERLAFGMGFPVEAVEGEDTKRTLASTRERLS